MPSNINRRDFLERSLRGLAGAGLVGALGAVPAAAADEDDPNAFVFARLKFRTLTNVRDHWDIGPGNDAKFLAYLEQATNMKLTSRSWSDRVIDIVEFGRAATSDAPSRVYFHPFVFMTSGGEFRLTDAEAASLAEYFKRGGFLWADDCVEQRHSFFYHAFLREIRKVLPGSRMQPMSHDHEIYHCFHDFPNGAPYCQGERQPDMGLFHQRRLVAFLTSGDVHCGWEPAWGPYASPPELCYQFGVNVVVYAMTH